MAKHANKHKGKKTNKHKTKRADKQSAKAPSNNGASWSATELGSLKKLAKAGTAQAAAKQLGRTPAAVQQKAMREGISFRNN